MSRSWQGFQRFHSHPWVTIFWESLPQTKTCRTTGRNWSNINIFNIIHRWKTSWRTCYMIAMVFWWYIKVIMAWLPAEKGLWIKLDVSIWPPIILFHGDFSQPNKLQLVFTILQLRISWFPLFFPQLHSCHSWCGFSQIRFIFVPHVYRILKELDGKIHLEETSNWLGNRGRSQETQNFWTTFVCTCHYGKKCASCKCDFTWSGIRTILRI